MTSTRRLICAWWPSNQRFVGISAEARGDLRERLKFDLRVTAQRLLTLQHTRAQREQDRRVVIRARRRVTAQVHVRD